MADDDDLTGKGMEAGTSHIRPHRYDLPVSVQPGRPANDRDMPDAHRSFDHYRRILHRFFSRRKLPPSCEADDLTQDVMLRLHARKGEQIENIEGYIFETASKALIDAGRRAKVRHAAGHIELTETHHSTECITPERIVLGVEELNGLMNALERLPVRTRAIFLLCRVDGESYAAVADRIGISISAIEKHMMKAIRFLATEYAS